MYINMKYIMQKVIKYFLYFSLMLFSMTSLMKSEPLEKTTMIKENSINEELEIIDRDMFLENLENAVQLNKISEKIFQKITKSDQFFIDSKKKTAENNNDTLGLKHYDIKDKNGKIFLFWYSRHQKDKNYPNEYIFYNICQKKDNPNTIYFRKYRQPVCTKEMKKACEKSISCMYENLLVTTGKVKRLYILNLIRIMSEYINTASDEEITYCNVKYFPNSEQMVSLILFYKTKNNFFKQ